MTFLEMCKYSTFRHKNKKNEDENDINKKYRSDFDIEESITNNYNRLLKDEKEDPSIIIPGGFKTQIYDISYRELLQAILDYCRELFRLENKQKSLEVEAKQRGLPVPQVLPSEKSPWMASPTRPPHWAVSLAIASALLSSSPARLIIAIPAVREMTITPMTMVVAGSDIWLSNGGSRL